jgi:hypothetical protein
MSYIGNEPTTVAFLTDTFSGNGSTVAFTMQVAPATTSSILVAITGVTQDPSTYSVVGTTLTFSAAPPTGTSNISVRYLGIPASGVTTTAYRTVTDFTATAGQTSFTVPSYTVGYIDVYRNGVRLGAADYTATTGTTVVLVNACTAGDLVVTESFYVSSVLNAIPATNNSVQQTYLASGVAGTGPAFSAYANTTQSISAATWTKVNFSGENYDTNNNFSSSRFTPSVAGYYIFTSSVYFDSSPAGQAILTLSVNGAASNGYGLGRMSTTGVGAVSGSQLVYMNGSTDYAEIYYYSTGANTLNSGASTNLVLFTGTLVRAA